MLISTFMKATGILPKSKINTIIEKNDNNMKFLNEDKNLEIKLLHHKFVMAGQENQARINSALLESEATGELATIKQRIYEGWNIVKQWAINDTPIEKKELLVLAQILEPNSGAQSPPFYRQELVQLRGMLAPHYEDIPRQMNQVLYNISEFNNELTNLEKSIYAHFHIARIQPFKDGNKRTARMVQDAILMKANLPPGVIPLKMHQEYRDLLHEARKGHEDLEEIHPKITEFYLFLANRIEDTIDKISEYLKD